MSTYKKITDGVRIISNDFSKVINDSFDGNINMFNIELALPKKDFNNKLLFVTRSIDNSQPDKDIYYYPIKCVTTDNCIKLLRYRKSDVILAKYDELLHNPTCIDSRYMRMYIDKGGYSDGDDDCEAIAIQCSKNTGELYDKIYYLSTNELAGDILMFESIYSYNVENIILYKLDNYYFYEDSNNAIYLADGTKLEEYIDVSKYVTKVEKYEEPVANTALQIPEGKVTALQIPEGNVVKIQDSNDRVLWSKN